MGRRRYYIWFLIIFVGVCFGTLGDVILDNDGNKIVWQHNGQTFSITASPSMSESVDYLWPPADGAQRTAGQRDDRERFRPPVHQAGAERDGHVQHAAG